ncbi:hypothetical protein CVT24_003984 [Panaeolus cyanescens]|uniref:AB hydrolase-1 domain-containing protein n=1 Tax=Panaeolus cyanescens TaxID=181874 RepID=A0A409Y6A9_9AGAR|nr:hypothetical protein CVT24_003984 [Panaeolus cyanescens]
MEHSDISEVPPLKRTRDWSFYFVFLFAVLPLWSSVPIAWLFVAYSIYIAPNFWLYGTTKRFFFFIACCEIIFSVYHFYLARRVSGPCPHGPGEPSEIRIAYQRLLKTGLADLHPDGGDIETLVTERPGSPAETITQLERHDPRAIDFRHCLRTWFLKVPWSTIKRLQVRQWLYWAMFNAELPVTDTIPQAQKVALDEALALLEQRLGCKIEEGSNPSVVPMRLTIDKTNIHWRPLSFYLAIRFINWGLRKQYTFSGNMRHEYYDGIEYLIYTPVGWNSHTSPRPMVFLHGLGLGLLQYHTLISHLLNELPDRPLLVPLQPQISQDFFHPHFLKPLGRHQMADKLAGLLQKLGWVTLHKYSESSDSEESEVAASLVKKSQRGITLLSHSNGSYTHAWILKTHPEIVGRSCFVDPVTFCSWEGDVCYNFFYRPCMTGIELVMRYFVGAEIGVTNYLQRHFCWTSNSLWFEEIPNARDIAKTFYVMGGKDDIVHSERVKKYLSSHGVRKNLRYDPHGRHGEALIKGGAGLNEILRWISEHE